MTDVSVIAIIGLCLLVSLILHERSIRSIKKDLVELRKDLDETRPEPVFLAPTDFGEVKDGLSSIRDQLVVGNRKLESLVSEVRRRIHSP